MTLSTVVWIVAMAGSVAWIVWHTLLARPTPLQTDEGGLSEADLDWSMAVQRRLREAGLVRGERRGP